MLVNNKSLFVKIIVGVLSFFALTSPALASSSPTGTFDLATNSTCEVAGWAKDPDTTNPISISIYKNGPIGQGTLVKTLIADVYRGDLPFTDKNHGFVYRFDFSSGLFDNIGHTIYIYGIDATGNPNANLYSSPKTITCASKNDAAFVTQTVPTTMVANTTYQVSVTIKNTGNTVWTQAGNYKLGSQNPAYWGVTRVLLNSNETINPNQTKTFSFTVTAPATAGSYNFQWKMLKEGVEWFGGVTPNVVVGVSLPTFVNVRDFGALGNGVADDSMAIKQAISRVAAGGTVYIPSGTYMLGTSAGGVENYPDGAPIQSAIVVNKNNLMIQGDGNTTLLKLMPAKKMRVMSITSSGVVVEKIAVDGNKSQRNGTVSYPGGDVVDALVYGSSQSSNITVRSCEVKNGIEDGIGFWQSPNSYVHDCTSSDNGTLQAGAAGIVASGNVNTGAKFTNNIVKNNTGPGVWLGMGASSALVDGNIIENNRGAGITTGGDSPSTTLLSRDITVKNNTIQGNGIGGFAGISIYSAQNGTVSNNQVVNNYYPGIMLNDNGVIATTNWLIENNICSNTNSLRLQKFGIKVVSLAQNITLRGNTCQDNGTSINNQIQIQNASAVNSDWQTVNNYSYAPL